MRSRMDARGLGGYVPSGAMPPSMETGGAGEDEAVARALLATRGQATGSGFNPNGAEEQAAMLAAIQARHEQEQLHRAMSASLGQDVGPPSQRAMTEEEQLQRALTVSQQEEEARERQRLRDEQRAELEESLLIDQQRESERQFRSASASSFTPALTPPQPLPQATPARTPPPTPPGPPPARTPAVPPPARTPAVPPQAAQLPSQSAGFATAPPPPPEPQPGEPGRLEVLVRLPDGKRLRRAFRQQDVVGDLYNFVENESSGAAVAGRYQLVSAMPRQVFADRGATLVAAGLQGQCALLVEAVDG